jgi:transposase
MNLHLIEISRHIATNAHAIILVDQAGWHITGKLELPSNISLVTLPSKCPELNPVENIWEYLRDNWLSNRSFNSYEDIVDHCCSAWNNLIAETGRIRSIGYREWAHQS